MRCYAHNFNSSNHQQHNCNGTFDECKTEFECSNVCFLLLELNGTRISAGCGLDQQTSNEEDKCDKTCRARPKSTRYYCCCAGDLCNYNYTITKKSDEPLVPSTTTRKPNPIQNEPSNNTWWHWFPALFVIFLLVGLLLYNKRRTKKNHHDDDNHLNQAIMVPMITMPQFQDGPIRNNHQQNCYNVNNNHNHHHHHHHHHHLHHGMSSLNGDGDPDGPRIDLKSMELLETLGQGRFGIVYRAYLADEKDGERKEEVAVKVIKAQEYESWQNERFVYRSHEIRHSNILNYFYSDEHVESNSYWLVVEYAPRGSLCSHLKENTVDWNDFLNMALGIVRGLNHLHDSHIAHRDFKSTNILLKQDLTPCITDFGVAKIFDSSYGSQIDPKKYHQVGTPRYMSPEVLECNIVFTKSSILKIDVYALALVLWELLSRTILPTNIGYVPPPYILPFEDLAGHKPSIERMLQIVVHEKQRPPLREEWTSHPRLGELCRSVLGEGWDTDSESRITASCLLERVTAFVDREKALSDEY